MSKNKKNQQPIDMRRKRVQRIKNIIIFLLIIFWLIPTFLSIFLVNKVVYLEQKMEQYISKQYDNKNNSSGIAKAETKRENQTKPSAQPIAPEKKNVYLTFEDGPSQYTEEILDTLKKEKVKATFFVIGHEEDRFSAKMYRRIVKEGHTLGMHSYSHFYDEIYESPGKFEKDFMKLHKYLYQITGEKPKFYRFPGGSSNSALKAPIGEYAGRLKAKGITYLDWNVVCRDDGRGKPSEREELIQTVMRGIAEYDASIVLMDDSSVSKNTAKLLKLLIKQCKAKGYKLQPIDGNTKLIQHAK